MILARSFDVDAINRVVNAPEVRPFIGAGDAGALDMAGAVAIPENHWLMGEHGGFAMSKSGPRDYEVHTFILKGGRGEWARQAARDAITIMSGIADRLWTKILPEQGNVVAFATAMGMKPTGAVSETLGEPYGIYEMEIG
jgi:hypothetical protein